VLWVGVHEKLPRGTAFDPDHLDDGLGVVIERFGDENEKSVNLPDTQVVFGYLNPKYEFSLFLVTSRHGLLYRFYRYGQFR
jgi:hypothetical protein